MNNTDNTITEAGFQFKEVDLENNILGHDFYIMMRNDFFGVRDSYENFLRHDGAIYISDDVWLTTSGEYICEEK